MERKVKREKEDTTERATDGLLEMTVKIGRTAGSDVTKIKRRETEGREEMERETNQDGTENLKS
jgi:hypothetical protein